MAAKPPSRDQVESLIHKANLDELEALRIVAHVQTDTERTAFIARAERARAAADWLSANQNGASGKKAAGRPSALSVDLPSAPARRGRPPLDRMPARKTADDPQYDPQFEEALLECIQSKGRKKFAARDIHAALVERMGRDLTKWEKDATRWRLQNLWSKGKLDKVGKVGDGLTSANFYKAVAQPVEL